MKYDVFAHTPEEKRELAIEMYRENRTYREICKELHLSPTTLHEIIIEEFGSPEDVLEKQLAHKSNESKALMLFVQNKNPLEVAIELEIASEDAIAYHQKYQQLKCIPLDGLYMKLKNEIALLESAKQNAASQLNDLRNQTEEQSRALQYYRNQCEQMKNEVFVLNYYANNLHAFLSNVQRRRARY